MKTTTYVALGYPAHNGMSLEPPPPVVLAVSRDEAVVSAFIEGLRELVWDATGVRQATPPYVHEGRKYQSVDIIEAVDLDGVRMGKRVAGLICGVPMNAGNVATPLCCEPPGHYPATLHRGNGSYSNTTWREPE